MPNVANRIRLYATVVVLAHLVVNLVHGSAHQQLHIDLSSTQMLFVVAVILIGPLVALPLLWSRAQRLGFGLLALTMGGALIFGLYNHFVAAGPDHVSAQGTGQWGTTFVITAWLLLMAEAAGTYIGLRYSRSVIE